MKTAKTPPTRIFLVRHGAAEGADGIAVGQIDLPLSARGARSIRELADSWSSAEAPARLYSSDLLRSSQSAEILAEQWRLEVEVDGRLREMSFGEWDGLEWAEIRRRDGAVFEQWMKCWWHRPAPGGESMDDVAVRARGWLDDVLAAAGGQTVVAVGHGGSIRTVLCHALGMPLEHAFNLRLDHGWVTVLATSWRGLEVEVMNCERFPRLGPGQTIGS